MTPVTLYFSDGSSETIELPDDIFEDMPVDGAGLIAAAYPIGDRQ